MPRYRFGEHEFRSETGELFHAGERVRLQPQPVQILGALLARPGELVTRQELIKTIWGDGALADVETGLNIAVKKLRDALGDSADQPQVIETLPRRGYRLIAQVKVEGPGSAAETITAPAQLPPRRLRRPIWVGLVLVGLVSVALVWKFGAGRTRALDFRPRDAVVVAQFANGTGDKNLDGVIESALEAELTASSHVVVASPERVADALRLMRQPVVPRVPPALAREVCLRDSGLRAAITGYMRKVGSGYFISAEIIRPEDGRTVTTLNESFGARADILRAIRRLAVNIRARLGEPPQAQPQTGEPLERVTTDSFEALKLYTEANALVRTGKQAPAEKALRRAVEIDPEFASAYILLAWSLHNQYQGIATEECLRFADRALELAGRVPLPEEQFIRGSHAFMNRDYEQAKAYFEALFFHHPENYWAIGNLVGTYMATGDLSKIRIALEKALLARPNDLRIYRNLSLDCFCGPNEDTARALDLVEKAITLAQQEGARDRYYHALSWRYQTRGMIAWLRGDVNQTLANFEEVRKLMPEITAPAIAFDISAALFALGRIEEADAMIQHTKSAFLRDQWGLWRAILSADAAAIARHADEIEKYRFTTFNAQGLVRAGRLAAVEKMLAGYQEPTLGIVPQAVLAVRGELAFHQGRIQDGIAILTRFAADSNTDSLFEQLPAAQTLARAHIAQGNPDKAIQVLEKATAAPRMCNDFDRAAFWPYARLDLLRLYRSQGRHKEADAVHKELANLMQLADANHPILAGLRNDAARTH